MDNAKINQNTFSKEFFDVLPFFNFILSLLIVMHHSFNLDIDYNVKIKSLSWFCERFFYNLSECAVPIFFFVSALLFYRNYDGTMKTYKSKLKKRFFSIIIPYLIFNVLGYIKHLIFSNEKFQVSRFISSIVTSNTMPLWFLRELFILIVLAPVIFELRKHLKVAAAMILAISFLIILGIVKYRSFCYWFPIYFVGTLCEEKTVLNITWGIRKKNLHYSLFFLICVFACLLPNTVFKMSYGGNLFFYCFRIFSVLVGILVLGILMSKRPKVYWFMNYSFWVYCVHFPFISIINMGFNKIFSENNLGIVQYFLTVLLVYCLSALSGHVIKKYTPGVWNVLNGCR